MKIGQDLIKIIDKRKDDLCEVMLGNKYDEDNQLYSKVYKYELNSYISYLDSHFSKLEQNGLALTLDSIKPIMLTNWGCGLDSLNMDKLDCFIMECISVAKKTDSKQTTLLNEENDFLSSLLYKKVDETRNLLLKLYLDDKGSTDYSIVKLINDLKTIDNVRYTQMIENLKREYIIYSNILYKLYNICPRGYNTHLTLHEGVCSHYSIDRSEFLF